MTNGNSAELKPSQKWTDRKKAVIEWENKVACHGGCNVTAREMACFEDGFEAAREALSVCADGGKGEEVARYDLNGEFMKRSAYGEWVRFDDTAPQAIGKGEAVAWRDVVKAIRAVDSEAARRGEMYPQTRDDQRDDRVATRRVCEMIEWYATKGGAVAESLDDWPKLTAPQAECAPRDRASSMPGGCECSTCGRVFIGGPAHSECGECAPRADRSVDSTYIAGMKAGYNFGVLEDNAGMQKCIEQRLKDIRESRLEVQAECAPREAQPVAWRVVAMRPNAIMKWAAFCQHHEALNCAKQWPEQIPYLASCVIEVQPLYTAPTPDVTGMRTLVHQIVALEPLKHPDNMENAVRILSRVIAAPTPERAQESAGVPLLVCSETIREAILRRDMHACGLAYGLASLARSILDADKEPQP